MAPSDGAPLCTSNKSHATDIESHASSSADNSSISKHNSSSSKQTCAKLLMHGPKDTEQLQRRVVPEVRASWPVLRRSRPKPLFRSISPVPKKVRPALKLLFKSVRPTPCSPKPVLKFLFRSMRPALKHARPAFSFKQPRPTPSSLGHVLLMPKLQPLSRRRDVLWFDNPSSFKSTPSNFKAPLQCMSNMD